MTIVQTLDGTSIKNNWSYSWDQKYFWWRNSRISLHPLWYNGFGWPDFFIQCLSNSLLNFYTYRDSFQDPSYRPWIYCGSKLTLSRVPEGFIYFDLKSNHGGYLKSAYVRDYYCISRWLLRPSTACLWQSWQSATTLTKLQWLVYVIFVSDYSCI